MRISKADIQWKPSFRIIATKYPPVNFFERIAADPEDWEILLEIEQLTDPGLNIGNLSMLEPEGRSSGPGAGLILPTFTFFDPTPPGSRFSGSNFGAYYAAVDLDTAIAETVHHRQEFLASTAQPPQDLDQLVILADIVGCMDEIRNMQGRLQEVYSPTNYVASQALAAQLRSEGSNGIAYSSVRRTGGECVAVLRARMISNAREDRHITYRWDGLKITGFYDKSEFHRMTLYEV